MKIAINAVALASAGGLSVGLNFLRQIRNNDLDLSKVIVFVPAGCNYEQFRSELIEIIVVPNLFRKHFFRLFTDFIWLPYKIKKTKPDVIFSMGNFGTPIKNIPQAILFHWAYAVYPESPEIWNRMTSSERLKRKTRVNVFKNRLKYANVVFPQTHTIASRLTKYYPESPSVVVIPNAYSQIEKKSTSSKNYFNKEQNRRYLLCLSHYYTHKNLDILIEVAHYLKIHRLNVSIILTISKGYSDLSDELLEKIESNQLSPYIFSVGQVTIEDVSTVYGEVDALILPTLLESFSGTYVDAMHFEKTIFTSDRDFAREVCGEAAYYFDPLSAEDIIRTIEKAFANPEERQMKIEAGKQRVQTFPDWKAVAQMYLTELKKLHE
ncbi:MAG: glycosyltransferase family 4 protein [Saprospiraceae bacterium]|nr:glycosyltransferase family 4 protein [Saprospiraceae bacterium]